MRRYTTRHECGNGHYPSLRVVWREDEDGHGFMGEATFWKDGDTSGCTHSVHVRQGMPMGHLFLTTDGFVYGCWSMATVPVLRLDEEALMWAGAWAVESLKRKHLALKPGTEDVLDCGSRFEDERGRLVDGAALSSRPAGAGEGQA